LCVNANADSPGRYLVPDVAVFHGTDPPDVPSSTPLVVIEILSPIDRMPEVLEKLEEYHAWGVPHIWVVDPETRRMYSDQDGLKTVQTLLVPELDLQLTSADIFPR
jgi:Uma2 family endonuclease